MHLFMHAPNPAADTQMAPPLISATVLTGNVSQEGNTITAELPEKMYRLVVTLDTSPEVAVSLLMTEVELKKLIEELQAQVPILVTGTMPPI